MESNGLTLFLPIRAIDEQGLGHLFLLHQDSSPHFFNKTDFKQYRYFFSELKVANGPTSSGPNPKI